MLCECKNNSNPLAFIGRPKNQTDRLHAPEEMVFSHIDKDAFFDLGFGQVHYDFLTETKAVQFCRIDRKGKTWHANHGGLYDSLFYPMAKALMARKRELHTPPRSEWRHIWLFVPMVVTSSDIFYIDSTTNSLVPEERSYVTFKREIRSSNINGTFAVDFIRQDQLEHFFSTCLQPLMFKMASLTMGSAEFDL